MTTFWTQKEAVEMCVAVEKLAPLYGYHVGLTGGTLYKGGFRKDADLIFYPHLENGEENPNREGLFAALEPSGLKWVSESGWVVKAKWREKPIDCFFLKRAYEGTYVKVTE